MRMDVDYKLFAEHHLSASSVPGQRQASQDLHQQQGEFANSTIVFGQGPIQSNPKVLKTFVLSPEDFDNEENPQTSSPGEVSDFREVSQPVVWDHRYHATAGKNLIIFFNS